MKFRPGWDERKGDLREELEAHLRMAVEERVAPARVQKKHARTQFVRWETRR